MRCEEIRERLVEVLYSEPSSPDLESHVRSCAGCRDELDRLKSVRGVLQAWKDEIPLRSVSFVIPPGNPSAWRSRAWSFARYAGVAAMLVFAFVALAGADFKWDDQGMRFRTHHFSLEPAQGTDTEFFTKSETRQILERVLDETESRQMLMIQRMLETIEKERDADLLYMRNRLVASSRNN